MSAEAARRFVENVESDKELLERVTAAATGKPDDALATVVAIGSEAGYSFSAVELKEATAGLTDEQLDQAAGGASYNFYEAWPCKWYVPELDSDSSGRSVGGDTESLSIGSTDATRMHKL